MDSVGKDLPITKALQAYHELTQGNLEKKYTVIPGTTPGLFQIAVHQTPTNMILADIIITALDPNEIDSTSLQSSLIALNTLGRTHNLSFKQQADLLYKIQLLTARVNVASFRESLQKKFPTQYKDALQHYRPWDPAWGKETLKWETLNKTLRSLETLLVTDPIKGAEIQINIERIFTRSAADNLLALLSSRTSPEILNGFTKTLDTLIKLDPIRAQNLINSTLEDLNTKKPVSRTPSSEGPSSTSSSPESKP